LTINTQKTKYLSIGTQTENLVLEGNRETCKEYEYLGTILNREKTNQEINKGITKARRIIACLNGIL